MSKQRTKRQKAIIRRRIFLSCCCAAFAAIIALAIFITVTLTEKKPQKSNASSNFSSAVSSEPLTESFATVLSTGDIMAHSTQLTGAKTSDGYDFSAFFKETQKYFTAADLSVANLEVTFGGTESGKYSGYPAFNTPDSLADAVKASGLNFLVTSNNHSYDTGLFGLKRTVSVLKEKNIEFIGTRDNTSDPLYTVKEVNGIKIGMADYTYETDGTQTGRKYLNGNILAEEANELIASFNYNRIEEFYTEAEAAVNDMKAQGAEFIVFYMHWGNEYELKANTWQKSIAQRLSNMGVNIIIGSHPHVVQPVELIHSEDGQTDTVCVYSTGNAVSNQRKELIKSCPTGHTEDGMLFTYTLKKYGDEVTLVSVDLIPTWVNKYKGGNGYLYTIYPLETSDDGSTKYGLSSSTAEQAKKSYERTRATVCDGLTAVQKALGCEVTFNAVSE